MSTWRVRKLSYKMLADGAFVAGDDESRLTSYAYPGSPHALVAKKYPRLAAEDMLESERQSYRSIPAVQEYDRKNWERLNSEESNASA